MSASRLRLSTLATLATLGLLPSILGACGGKGTGPGEVPPSAQRVSGQSDFTSAPLPGQGGVPMGTGGGQAFGAGGADNGGTAPSAPSAGTSSSGGGAASSGSAAPRTVEETDLYRVDGNRLYYLNSYRGLMVFDITDVDHPKLLGRSAIFGDPQEMYIRNNVAVVVVGDWYGALDDGSPFHGSVARGLDCNDPTNIKVVGETRLGGWVQDTRIVGDVLYTVAQDYGWEYGWGGWNGYYGGGVAVAPGGAASGGGGTPGPSVTIASVSFAGGVVKKVGERSFTGYDGIFNVTSQSIMLAHQHPTDPNTPYNGQSQTDLQYVDISDPGGAIGLKGSITINGYVSGWGPDNGRWNLDFADGKYAHTIGCASQYCYGSAGDQYVLSTVDFTNPDAPAVASTLPIANLGWSVAARFDSGRMYLSPSNYSYNQNGQTPLSIYDISDPKAPKLAGQTGIDGTVWLLMPSGQDLFALGNNYGTNGNYNQDQVEVQYFDVTNAASPQKLGSTAFGQGWAWTPAAGTFKAFVIDASKGLALVPFSGWDYNSYSYTNGVQLVQFTISDLTGSSTARTKGWVERGIFVSNNGKNRLLSLSDQALSVVDYSNPKAPQTVSELTLARNVVNAQPQGDTIAELSSDWWGNDNTTSEMRVLPIANAEETTDDGTGVSVNIPGVDANVFQNGALGYVVTDVQHPVPCGGPYGGYSGPNGTCLGWTQQVQVVDTSNGGATLRGKVSLPDLPYYYGGWGWYGFWFYDWYDGANVVQIGDALAFRRWFPQYHYDQATGGYVYDDTLDALYVVDLKNPDAPTVASLTITSDTTTWWGNMRAVGNTLYTTHFEWIERPDPKAPSGTIWYVKYYLDEVDLTDRAHPKVGKKINVPGVLVGSSSTDPSMLYFADYRWDSDNPRNDISVCQIVDGKAYFQSRTPIDGWVGNVIVQNDKAYLTAQEYAWELPNNGTQQPFMELHQLDLGNPQQPKDYVAVHKDDGWGWLLGVAGDRAIITSGWGPVGIDIYRLQDSAAPTFDKSVRTRGWWTNSITRQDNSLFLTSGYWGVQRVDLQ
jgi:hypothetical protein